ncbi:MAG: tRNA pseudouridine(55) synthase TruB [bacterium]|nr:tRNA pseudouridine(55) synthase TruB [bacterium]
MGDSPGTPPSGIITLNKPVGLTSAKALYRVRKITRVRKSGHAGTLDPAADGVLVLCLGKATKLVEAVMDQPKVYRAWARLDVTSTSFDSDAELVPVAARILPSFDQVRDALGSFEGHIQQVPPAVSALKIGGQPAYKLVRQGVVPKLAPRPARVYWMHLHRLSWPTLEFEMCCGRGTYVRAIIRDLGQGLGTGGCLTALTRTAVGPFRLEDAVSFADLEQEADPLAALLPLEQARESLGVRPIPIPPRPA